MGGLLSILNFPAWVSPVPNAGTDSFNDAGPKTKIDVP
jgi:hypothetical protein